MSGIRYMTAVLGLCMFLAATVASAQGMEEGLISGRVVAADNSVAVQATVALEGTAYSSVTNEQGLYHLKAPAGTYRLVVTGTGYREARHDVTIRAGARVKFNVRLKAQDRVLGEAVVSATGVGRVRRSAYNAVAIDTRALANTTQNLSDALARVPGMKLRESGGVGSDMQFLMDGFAGKHVKVFIDGVPQEGVGGSFGLNNIPVNFAERVEVYKGVVPVGFGTDALGGVVNIVTRRQRKPWFLEASYSYGSFNTHKSYLRFGQQFKSGWTYEVNAFQNYSDNDYWIDTPVEHFLPDGGTSLNSKLTERVRRFNDTYHNEAVVAKAGITGKSWADRLLVGFTYSHMYKEVQNGVVQKVVFGRKHNRSHALMPSLEYVKRGLFTKGLDVTLTANFNADDARNIDTAAYHFNWYGESRYMGGQLGEQSYQDTRSKNRNWNVTATAVYRLGTAHTFTLSEVTNNFSRSRRSAFGTTSTESESIDKLTRKNILGLSYRLMPSERWNVSVFGKYYHQYNAGPVSTSATGTSDYVRVSATTDAVGYGAAATWFLLRGLQAKLSYERAYRLPTNDELFGDEDLELGSMSLRPERSHNANLSLSYDRRIGRRHGVYAEAGVVYRDTRDFIQRRIGNYSGGLTYATYENHGRVLTKGYNLSLRYSYGHWFSVGGTYNRTDVRDNVKTLSSATGQANMTYKARIPNQPYSFANMDATFSWPGLFGKGNALSLTYDNFYVHSFPLYAENLGARSTKDMVPTQFSHNLTITYSLRKGRYNLSFECRNLTDEKLYDNFSLQKAGRAFYGKVRVSL